MRDLDLTQLDGHDRRIVAALQDDGRASWTAIAELCDVSVPTVARRAQQLLADGVVRVGVAPSDINHAGPAEMFVLRISCAAGRQLHVAARLAARDDIRFLAIVTGPIDIIAELCTRKNDSLHARIIEELMTVDGVVRCETDLVLHVYKVSHDWSRQLLNDDARVVVPTPPHECAPDHFDETDHAILARLRDDGRAGFREIAEAVKVNESTVRRRLETLRSSGCVHVVTIVPAAALGFEAELQLAITVAPARLDAVASELTRYRGVRYLAATLNNSSLMCELILPTSQDVFAFLTTTLAKLDGVRGWAASMELITFKRGFIRTPWSRGLLGAN